MTLDEFTDKLKAAGWRATCDAQYAGIEKFYQEVIGIDRAAREDCARICEAYSKHNKMHHHHSEAAADCADEIRETIK